MKSKLVDFAASNEDHVRLRIFDGDIPASEGMGDLLRLERAQHDATRRDRDEWRRRAVECGYGRQR